jgi:adenylyl-sulfate kinase
MKSGMVIWMTGLSGAGKTTLARYMEREISAMGLRREVLDGDEVRETLSRGLGFSREDRETNIHRIGFVARLLARNGVVVIVAAISPYRDTRDQVRRLVEDDAVRFAEVFVKCPLDELIERDTKGLYRKALAGEIENFTGIDDPYEEPTAPDFVVDTATETVEQSARKLLLGLLNPGVSEGELVAG